MNFGKFGGSEPNSPAEKQEASFIVQTLDKAICKLKVVIDQENPFFEDIELSPLIPNYKAKCAASNLTHSDNESRQIRTPNRHKDNLISVKWIRPFREEYHEPDQGQSRIRLLRI